LSGGGADAFGEPRCATRRLNGVFAEPAASDRRRAWLFGDRFRPKADISKLSGYCLGMVRIPGSAKVLFAAAVLGGCAANPIVTTASAPANAPGQAVRVAPSDRFYASLQAMCGKAFAGRVVIDTPAAPDDPTWQGARAFVDKPLLMHVRGCGKDQLRIPFHVGEDRSRTWVITRFSNASGENRLRLKHDHRHQDGSADVWTMYGGDSIDPGTDLRQRFPVDEFSTALSVKLGRSPATATNIWTIELQPGVAFSYEISRLKGREKVRVEFDLTRPLPPPPVPWGDEG